MDDKSKKMLTERGRKFVKYGLGQHYIAYNATMFYKSYYGNVHFTAKGRVMIDSIGYAKMNPNSNEAAMMYGGANRRKKYTEIEGGNIEEELLFLTWPIFKGYSFRAKRWGEMFVDKIEEIEFDDTAFDALVIEERKKKLAKAMVLHANEGFTDVISGKSGGAIFLLHGPPGTGKTLTCEATAELLHRPLYSITVGELGTTPDILEHKLTEILEMANSWNSIILIDGADIFLEKRTDNDMVRYAMVGIFLRLLEHHQGVMFLTTNRVDALK